MTNPSSATTTALIPVRTVSTQTRQTPAMQTQAMPVRTASAQTVPARTMPARTMPAQSAPARTATAQTATAQTAPGRAAPAQSASTRALDPHRWHGYGAPHLVGTVLLAIAVTCVAVGVVLGAAAVATLSGLPLTGHPVAPGDSATGAFGAMTLGLGAVGCVLAGVPWWIGSVFFRWMAAMYTRRNSR